MADIAYISTLMVIGCPNTLMYIVCKQDSLEKNTKYTFQRHDHRATRTTRVNWIQYQTGSQVQQPPFFASSLLLS